MTRRTALVVGVSSYKKLAPLPNSTRDAQAMEAVLKDVAGFDKVDILIDPELTALGEAIEEHFVSARPDDLVLFYFSGHGITDDDGRLHFAVPTTHKHRDGTIIRASALTCQQLQEAMHRSRSRHQVIILDCCNSGAFEKGFNAKNDGTVDLRPLGGEGRVVLASSSAVEASYEGTEAGLSVYTDLLYEGIVSGAADLNHDGFISIGELHEFAKTRIQSVHKKMTPRILPSREGYNIVISKARQVDPNSAYQAKVLAVADADGQLSSLAAEVLSTKRLQLKLPEDDARRIEQLALAPLRARADNRARLRRVVLDARRKGEFEASRTLVDELRKSLDLSEQDLQVLLEEPIHAPRRPSRVNVYAGVAFGALVLVGGAALMPSWSASGEQQAPARTPDGKSPPAQPVARAQVDPGATRSVADAELDRVLQVDRSTTTWSIRISADNTFAEARDIARTVLNTSRFMPWIVHQDFDKNLYIVYVGGYSSASAAKADEAAARAVVKQGAITQNVQTKCPSLTWSPGGYHQCSQVISSR